MTSSATLLLLADGRLPTGAHVDSGGVEEAVSDGRLTGEADLGAYLAGRLATVGLVDAALAAAAAEISGEADDLSEGGHHRLAGLDAEAGARCAIERLRTVSRRQGRGLLRAARRLWPAPILELVAALNPEGPMWSVALGAVAKGSGLEPGDAALVAAEASITGPAWAAVRLLGLDPFAVGALLARSASSVDATAVVASQAAASAVASGDLCRLPSTSGPLLELAGAAHGEREGRLFAS